MAISVKIPNETMITIAINWSLAKCSCPSWSAKTDESTLRSAVASLEDCSSSLHGWLGFWTFLVALGVLLEVVAVVWEYLDELHDFRRGIIHPPERPITLLFVLGLAGAGLVAAGVSGEVWEESRIATVETCIRKGNDALFLLLSKEAEDAKDSALIAKTSADAATSSAGEAQGKATKAEASARSAEGDARSAQQDAAKLRIELNKAIADVEAAQSRQREIDKILQIQAEYAAAYPNGPPLRLLKNDLLELLSPLPPAMAEVEYKWNDPEALAFARVIIHAI